jgi:molybdate transport system substrate-binding protein
MRRPTCALAAAALLVTALAGCSSSSGGAAGGTSPTSSPSPTLTGSITVFAAASLEDVFKQIGTQFEAAHPGVTVTFSFNGSNTLATQIVNGAPADVFASAAPANMATVVNAGDASSSVTFAKNTMEIATPPSNPANVTGVSSLASSSVKVAVCQAAVPCGVTAQAIFKNAGITVTPVTEETEVSAVLTKVELDEVDAGIVYVTNVLSAGSKVKGIVIPANINASTDYPIAALTKSANPSVAAAFVAYVLSPAGQSILSAAGFEKP